MAVDTEGAEDGKILSGNGKVESSKQLRINGSLSGDVNDIFSYRRPLGLDALKNEGAVSIFYDQRILLNPPPGLSDFINNPTSNRPKLGLPPSEPKITPSPKN